MTRYIRCPFGVFELKPHRRVILWHHEDGRLTYTKFLSPHDDNHHCWKAGDIKWRIEQCSNRYREITAAEAKKIIKEMQK